MKQKNYQKTLKRLSKLMSYILRHHPEEFGLVLDQEGFVSLKELHQAIIEEKDWSFVRISHIKDIVNFSDKKRFETKGDKIRASYGHSLAVQLDYQSVIPPKLLYHATTRKAYPRILEKGLLPMGRQYVHLTIDKELSLRIGKRRDKKPVLLEIQAKRAYEAGIEFYCPNELIYLVKTLPPQYISGPPLHKIQIKIPQKPAHPSIQVTPGSFLLTEDMIIKEKQSRAERYARKKLKKKKP